MTTGHVCLGAKIFKGSVNNRLCEKFFQLHSVRGLNIILNNCFLNGLHNLLQFPACLSEETGFLVHNL